MAGNRVVPALRQQPGTVTHEGVIFMDEPEATPAPTPAQIPCPCCGAETVCPEVRAPLLAALSEPYEPFRYQSPRFGQVPVRRDPTIDLLAPEHHVGHGCPWDAEHSEMPTHLCPTVAEAIAVIEGAADQVGARPGWLFDQLASPKENP